MGSLRLGHRRKRRMPFHGLPVIKVGAFGVCECCGAGFKAVAVTQRHCGRYCKEIMLKRRQNRRKRTSQ